MLFFLYNLYMIIQFFRNPFVYLIFPLLWLCGCPVVEVFEEGHLYDVNIEATKPAGVDSLKLCVFSTLTDSTSCSTASYSSTCYHFDWNSLKTPSEMGVLKVNIAFFCNNKSVSLPVYEIPITPSQRIFYDFRELDERRFPPNWDYELVSFIFPEDTSCGMFVNYAIFFRDIK